MSLALEPTTAPVIVVDQSASAPGRLPPWQLLVGLMLLGLVLAALAAQAAFLWERSKDEVWAARSEIEYRGESWVESQAVALSSRSLYEDTARNEGIALEDFAKDFSPELIPGTQVLRLQYEDLDAARAERIVGRLQQAYIDRFSEPPVAEDEVRTMLEADLLSIQGQIFAAETEIGTIEVLANQPIPPRLSLLQARVSNLNSDKATVQSKIVDLELEERRKALAQPRVLTEPFVLDEPVEPAPMRRAVLGAIAGLAIAVIISFIALRRYLGP